MRETMALLIWLDTAVSGIRFGPDREAVRGELYTHLEDKTADLMRIFPDLSPDEARDRALAGMGDAEELKVSLAKVHRPWLGWLWTASRLLVWGSLAVGLLLCLAYVSQDDFAWMEYKRQQNREMQAISRALFEDGMPEWEGERLTVYEPDSRVRLGRAALSVSKAALWREQGKERLYLQLQIVWDRPWEANDEVFFHLWAEDDLGNVYWMEKENQVACRGWGRKGTRTAWMNLYLDQVPPEAKQIRIHSKLRDGLNLAVDLRSEGEP